MHRSVVLGLVVGVGCAAPAVSDEPHGSTSSREVIGVDDVMARAQEWVDDRVPYCGGVRGGSDVLCGGTCNRPAAAWDAYRSDCSGFVSWVWQVTDDPSTDGFMNDRAGDNGWHTVAVADMARGDALVCDGHIKLLSSRVSDNSAEIYEESDCGLVASKSVQSFSVIDGNTFSFNGDGRTYHVIRRNGISGGGSGSSGGAEGGQVFVTPNQQHFFVQSGNDLGHAFWDASTNQVTHDTWGSGIAGQPVTFTAGSQQHAFARGTDGSLQHWIWDQDYRHDVWVTGGLASDPAVIQMGGGQHAFAADASGNLQHWWWTPDSNQISHDTWGSGIVGRPSALAFGQEQHAFARGTSGNLEHFFWEPSGGMHHDTWGSGITGEPAARAMGGGQHVFAVDGSGALQHWYWTAASGVMHDTWASGGLASDARPSIMPNGDAQHVFVRGASGAVEHYWWAPSGGIAHDTWGSGIATDPQAILIGQQQHVFAQAGDGSMQHWFWDASSGISHDTW
jgi:hypothetical protein